MIWSRMSSLIPLLEQWFQRRLLYSWICVAGKRKKGTNMKKYNMVACEVVLCMKEKGGFNFEGWRIRSWPGCLQQQQKNSIQKIAAMAPPIILHRTRSQYKGKYLSGRVTKNLTLCRIHKIIFKKYHVKALDQSFPTMYNTI